MLSAPLHHPTRHPSTQRTRTTRHQHRSGGRPDRIPGPRGRQTTTEHRPAAHRNLVLIPTTTGQHLNEPADSALRHLIRNVNETAPTPRLLQRDNPAQTPHTRPHRTRNHITRTRRHRTRRHPP
ncbi:hypothetical protein ABZ695_35840, partial [Streptomyces sp. NPDC006976]|uniref:hypothetical protein n=1 Tax=Streptomyces sp. NPDC006976 TaxID=3154311 RepID=UPI0034101A14